MSSSDSAPGSSSASSSSASSAGGHSDDDAPGGGGGASPLPSPPPAPAPPDVAGSLELAQVAHFCAAFRAPLKLSRFSRTELQAALENARDPDERQVALLAELHFKLTRDQTGVKLERMIQDWERAVARKLAENWRLEFAANPMASTSYAELSVSDRIRILNALCLWKAESCAEIRKHIATIQQDDPKAFDRLRGSEIGTDDRGVSYWYFDDACWVYAEDKPHWQCEKRQPLYITEFANGKRIRLSINFQADDIPVSQSQLVVVDTKSDVAMKDDLPPNSVGKAETLASKAVDVKDEEPLVSDATLKEEKEATAKASMTAAEASPPPPAPHVKEEARPASRKMDINLICGSPASDDTSVKSEKSTAVSDTQGSSGLNGMIKVESATNCSGVTAPPCRSNEPTATSNSAAKSEAGKAHDKEDTKTDLDSEPAGQHRDTPGTGSAKKRFIVDDDNTDSSDSGSEKKSAKKKAHSQEKHIFFASSPLKKKQKVDDTSAPVKETVAAPAKETAAAPVVNVGMPTTLVNRSDPITAAEGTIGDVGRTRALTELSVDTASAGKATGSNGAPAALAIENFDINCECCQKDYDMRYLDPPLVERPAGEWRCFECLVNDARGWPRRRKLTASPTAKAEPVADEKAKSTKKSSRSSSGKRSRPSSSKSSSSKTAGASSGSSKRMKSSGHSTSTSKKSSSSSKKHKKKKSSSSSHSHHHRRSSSSSNHHRRRHHHEYSKLLAAFRARNSERLSIEAHRVQEASRYDVAYLEGPTSWRVVSSSVESLRELIESLSGGSLEQERLRSHLISILKEQEKLEEERIKREELAWQILPRRQSSRIAIGKMRSQSSGSEHSDDAVSDDDESAGRGRRRAQRSGRTRSSDAAQAGEENKNQLALDRASRARRRHHLVGTDEHDGEEDEQDDDDINTDALSPGNWINWSVLKRTKRSLSTICLAAVDRLLKEEIADLFSRPVDPEFDGCPDYLTIITRPMDLGTIRTRLQSGSYTKWELFKSDVELVWNNCREFNGTDMMISQYADTLDALFKEMCKVAEKRGAVSMSDNREGGASDGASSDDNNNGNDDGHSSSSAESKAESKTSVNKEWTESSESESSGSSDASDSSDNRGKARSSRTGASSRSKSTPSSSSKSGRAATPRASSRSRQAAAKKQDSSESDGFSSDASDESDEVRRPTKRTASGSARVTRGSTGRPTALTPPKSKARSSASPRGSVPPPPPPPAHGAAKLKSSVSEKSPRPPTKAPVPRTARLRVSDSSSSDSDNNGKASSSSSSSSSDSSDDDDSDDGSDVDLHARRKESVGVPTPPLATKRPRSISDRSSAQPPPPPPPPSPPSAAAGSPSESVPPPPPPPPSEKKAKAKLRGGDTGVSAAGKKVPPRVAALKLDRVGEGAQAQTTHSPTLLRSYPSPPSSSSSSYFSSSADSDSSDSGGSDGGSE